MRTEYTIRITDEKGKIQCIVYPKKYADQKALECKMKYNGSGKKVEYFKVIYNGSAFYRAEKIF